MKNSKTSFKTDSIAGYCNKNGRVKTLKKLGETQLATDLINAEKLQKEVIEVEGIIPYDERPAVTRKNLSKAHEISSKAADVIWNNRNKKVRV